MMYEFFESQSSFSERHLLLVQENGQTVLVNLLILGGYIQLFGEQEKKFVKSMCLENLQESCLNMETTSCANPSTDLILTSKYGSAEDSVHLKMKHDEQKKRIVKNLLRAIKGTATNDSITDPDQRYVNDKQLRKPNKPPIPVWPSGSIPEEPNSTSHYESDESIRQESISTVPRPGVSSVKPHEEPIANLTEGSSTTLQQVYPESLPPVSNKNGELVENIYGLTIPDEKVWFLKEPIDRRIVETMMIDKPNGHFYIRSRNDVDVKRFPYALSFKYNNHVVHIKVERIGDGSLVLAPRKKGESAFNTIDDLVQHYEDHLFPFTYDGNTGSMSLNRNRRY